MTKKIILSFFLILVIFNGFSKKGNCAEKLELERVGSHELVMRLKEIKTGQESLSTALYDMNKRFYEMISFLQIMSVVLLAFAIFILILLIKVRKIIKQQYQNKEDQCHSNVH